MSRGIYIQTAIERHASMVLIALPGDFLKAHHTARPAMVHSQHGSCCARIIRRQSREIVLMLVQRQIVSLAIDPEATEVELWIDVLDERLRLTPPEDLEQVLLEHGVQWDSMSERDRHLAIGLVKEARTPEVRQARIGRILESLKRSVMRDE